MPLQTLINESLEAICMRDAETGRQFLVSILHYADANRQRFGAPKKICFFFLNNNLNARF